MNKISVPEKFSQIQDYWNPRIAGELNGQMVKLVKFKGEFVRREASDVRRQT